MSKLKTKKKRIVAPVISVFLAIVIGYLSFNYVCGTDDIIEYIEKNVFPVESEHDFAVTRDEEDGFYTFQMQDVDAADTELRVLQLTDIHLTCGYPTYFLDVAAVDAVYELVRATRPDLIVLTGDIVSPIIFTGATGNSALIARAVGALFTRMQIPWTVIYGNHDSEGFMSKSELSDYYESLDYCLFQRGPHDIDGEGNTVIKVKNKDGSLRHALFFLDSHGGMPGGYDNPHENQVAWYKDTVDALFGRYGAFESILYQHIPPDQQRTLAERYENGDTRVECLYGELGKRVASGTDYGLYDALVEKGTTKHVFFGHDHTNLAAYRDTTDGITLSYSPSIDFSTYVFTRFTSYQRGGTVVNIGTDGSARVSQIYSDDLH